MNVEQEQRFIIDRVGEETDLEGMLPEHQSQGDVQGAGKGDEEVSEVADREGEGAGDD